MTTSLIQASLFLHSIETRVVNFAAAERLMPIVRVPPEPLSIAGCRPTLTSVGFSSFIGTVASPLLSFAAGGWLSGASPAGGWAAGDSLDAGGCWLDAAGCS